VYEPLYAFPDWLGINFMKRKENENCMVPDCGRAIRTRGLCAPHYAYTCHLVQSGKYTWHELVEKGKVGKTKTGKINPHEIRNWFDSK